MATTATTERPLRRWLRRFGWLLAIWGASVLSLGLLTLLVRSLMGAAGLSH